MIFSKDKDRVSAFYRRTLGLEADESEKSPDLLRGSGLEFVIHAIPERIAADLEVAEPPVLRRMAAFKPAFVVADLEAMRPAAERAGGGLKPKDAVWTIRGAMVLDG